MTKDVASPIVGPADASFDVAVPRAHRLECSSFQQAEITGIRYVVDGAFSGEVTVDWSGVGGAPDRLHAMAIESALTVLVAQAALPAQIDTDTPLVGRPQVDRLLQMLYDIRCSCDRTAFRPAPTFTSAGTASSVVPARASLNNKKALVLLSGGMDSTFAVVALQGAGYDVTGFYVRANAAVEESEGQAAKSVAAKLGIPLYVMSMNASGLGALSRHYSRSFGRFPFYNAVPHGRDFPLAVIGATLADRLGCGSVVFGHDKESRHKVIQDRGRLIHRHDVESMVGRALVQEYIDATLGTGFSLFSPLAGMSIYSIRRAMYHRHPELVPHTRSCFWGTLCEKCLKCVTLYALERHLGISLMGFTSNPFSDKENEDLRLFAETDRPSEALGYGALMHYVMLSLVEAGKLLPEDYWLHRFQEGALARVLPRRHVIERICLTMRRPDEVPTAILDHLEVLS